MPHPFTIARLTDASRADELHALVTSAFAALAIEPPSGVLKESVADFRERLRCETALVALTCDPAAELIGSVFCASKGDSLYIGRLAVRDDFRRLGVASALIEAAKSHAGQLGIGRLTLSARIALKSNVALFEKHGFVVTGATAHPGFSHPTSLDMELKLA
jgi:GNAT superfamily N-acetyltransferase